MMRPVFFEFPSDETCQSMDAQFLVGADIMVAPVTKEAQVTQDVYLPGDQMWYDFDTGAQFASAGWTTVAAPIDKLPVFQRGGSVVPKRERARRSSALMARDPLTLVVALDNKGKASGSLFMDDGESFDYLGGSYIHQQFDYSDGVLTNKALHDGTFSIAPELTVERIVVRGLPSRPTKVTSEQGGSVQELGFVFEDGTNQLTIRKPAVHVTKPWSVTID